jgi:HlyD family secretion protein
MQLSIQRRKLIIGAAIVVALAAAVWLLMSALRPTGGSEAVTGGNGRIEATQIDVATKLPGRLAAVTVAEGEFVTEGQVLGRMQTDVLVAQRNEALAQQRQASAAALSAQAQVSMRRSDAAAAQALVVQRRSELDNAQRRLARSQILARQGAAPLQQLDDDRALVRNAEAAVDASLAQVKAAEAAIAAAQAQVGGAQATVEALGATVARIEADIADSQLKAPRAGRVQYLVAQPGEVLGAGGKVLNMIDVNDVYMTFFLPEALAGRVAMGAEVRIVLDAAPEYVVPATVSFVSSVAQFTPKTVETASEREKLMFKVKARIDPALVGRHLQQVKTGLPGIAWVKTDAAAPWPPRLAVRTPS